MPIDLIYSKNLKVSRRVIITVSSSPYHVMHLINLWISGRNITWKLAYLAACLWRLSRDSCKNICGLGDYTLAVTHPFVDFISMAYNMRTSYSFFNYYFKCGIMSVTV